MSQPLSLTPEDYDLLVDWPRRLRREAPLYRRLFDDLGARRVLDAACGTGHHLILFSRWGLNGTGSDADPKMIERAEANAAEAGADISFFVAPFADLPDHVTEPYDAVVCVGNSLSLVPDDDVKESLVGLAAAVRPGGVLVLHVLNAQQFAERRPVFLPLRVRERDSRPILFQKIYAPREDGLGVHFLVIEQQLDGTWQSGVDSSLIANRPPERILALVEAAGLERLETFGDYAGAPFERTSTDLIIVARRGRP